MATTYSNPIPALTINTLPGAVTSFIQTGTNFPTAGVPTLTVTDENADATLRYTFTVVSTTTIAADRLLVAVTCTPPPPLPAVPPAPPQPVIRPTTGSVKISVGGVDKVINIPVLFQARRSVFMNHSKLARQTLRVVAGNKSVMFFPITGLANPGQIIKAAFTSATDTIPEKGTWDSNIIARQQANRVKLTLKCTSTTDPAIVAAAGAGAGATSGTATSQIKITLTAEDGTTVDTPPVEVIYGDDPDDSPDMA